MCWYKTRRARFGTLKLSYSQRFSLVSRKHFIIYEKAKSNEEWTSSDEGASKKLKGFKVHHGKLGRENNLGEAKLEFEICRKVKCVVVSSFRVSLWNYLRLSRVKLPERGTMTVRKGQWEWGDSKLKVIKLKWGRLCGALWVVWGRAQGYDNNFSSIQVSSASGFLNTSE